MKKRTTSLLAIAVAALLATGCAVSDSVKDGTASVANGVANFVEEGLGVRERPGAREIILDLNPDTTSLPRIMSMVEPVVADAAADGAFVGIWIVTGGVAAAMAPVDLESANGGDLLPKGKNAAAWEREAQENTEAILAAIRAALTEYQRDDTGADLFGAISMSATRATELPGTGSPEVILLTSGIHRTADLDLQTIDFTSEDPADVAAAVTPVDAPTVSLRIIGAGRFPHVSPPPDATWAAGIRATWEAFCNSADTKSCTVSDTATTEEG